MNAIECRKLTKRFRGRDGVNTVLNDLSFSFETGRIVGLLGPDGAGKTTLLRILAGLLRPDGGTAAVLGCDAVRDAAKIQNFVGYMPQKFGLYENLSVAENLELYAELHNIHLRDCPERLEKLYAMTDLGAFRNRMAGALSGGMKQKLALICALIADPPLLLLDEPTVGVDVLSRRELWRILRDLVAEGKLTVFASTSYLDEAAYCDRTLILFAGRLIADGPPAEIAENGSFEDGFIRRISGSLVPHPGRSTAIAPDAPVLIKADNIVKRFGSFTAVDHVSFEVRRGEIFGLLGANGAGKTTTFRMLCGLSSPDEGAVEVAGYNLRTAGAEARKKIGYVAQKFSLYGDLTVRENLEFFGGAYGLHGERLAKRIDWAAENFELAKVMNAAAAKLPLGYKQRLSMSCALLHEPEIIFLDEATSGADPMARREFWQRIISLADAGVAVIITTHFLAEAEYCDRMVIMQSGQSIAAGSADDIRRQGESPDLEEAFVKIIGRFRARQGGAA